MQSDLSSLLVDGIMQSIRSIGSAGKVVLCLIIGFALLPVVLRILSFFRRGGEGV